MDRFEISTLRSYYGALLTQRQNDMLVMHYDEDLSFGEIANIVGISRQAVLDGINKGEKHLCEYEQKAPPRRERQKNARRYRFACMH